MLKKITTPTLRQQIAEAVRTAPPTQDLQEVVARFLGLPPVPGEVSEYAHQHRRYDALGWGNYLAELMGWPRGNGGASDFRGTVIETYWDARDAARHTSRPHEHGLIGLLAVKAPRLGDTEGWDEYRRYLDMGSRAYMAEVLG